MILYQLTDEDANRLASELGLERELTETELIEIKRCVENGLSEFWSEAVMEGLESCVPELNEN